ncbi:hypothetical protein [Rhodanobacter sp. C05]|uniref:hypothetical protein n=1 Tax=Rhodanobacter sp. C05 TaxID=1945855 RepID=UPI001179D56F|nr:hypothetical protein [Rhodanobacter sp. C05]
MQHQQAPPDPAHLQAKNKSCSLVNVHPPTIVCKLNLNLPVAVATCRRQDIHDSNQERPRASKFVLWGKLQEAALLSKGRRGDHPMTSIFQQPAYRPLVTKTVTLTKKPPF